MASKRAKRRRACGEKKRYTAEQAVKALFEMRVKSPGRWNVYKCSHCGSWHIGHIPAKVRKAIASRRGQEPG